MTPTDIFGLAIDEVTTWKLNDFAPQGEVISRLANAALEAYESGTMHGRYRGRKGARRFERDWTRSAEFRALRETYSVQGPKGV